MAHADTRAAATQPSRAKGPRAGLVIALVLAAAFMQLVDVSIVNVAVAEVQQDLGTTYSQLQWVLAGYTLAFAALLVPGGRLGDRYGRKRMFLLGMTGFTIASLLCGAAQTPGMLVGSRLLQGLTAALMYPQVYSVIQVTVPRKQRGAALGALGGIIGLAAITGPLVGGLLIQADLFHWGWRPIFLVNVPIGVVTVLLATRYLPESHADDPDPIDWFGVALVTTSIGALVYPLVQGRDLGWPRWSLGMLVAGACGLLVFAVYEQYRERRGRAPLIRMSLFKTRGFTGGLVLVLLFYGAFLPFFLIFSVYLQAGLGHTALYTGVALVPYALGSGLGSGVSIALAPRLGRNVLHIGLGLLIVGTCWIMWTVRQHGAGLHTLQLLPSLLVAGLGFGLTVTPLVTLILAKVPARHAGSASGTLTTVQQFGSAVGIAVLGTLFFGMLGWHSNAVTTHQVPAISQQVSSTGLSLSDAAESIREYKDCFHDRASEKDATATPASCRLMETGMRKFHRGGEVAKILATSAKQAKQADFAWSVQRILFLQVVLFAACFLIVFMLPKVQGEELAEFEKQSQDAVIIG
ncbi:MFS transporter [Streptomyces klenkii]|uniref:MFS transporter n=1 Tax=Streptomyces klenkii TaxID=1420899 RepID=UPI00340F8C50